MSFVVCRFWGVFSPASQSDTQWHPRDGKRHDISPVRTGAIVSSHFFRLAVGVLRAPFNMLPPSNCRECRANESECEHGNTTPCSLPLPCPYFYCLFPPCKSRNYSHSMAPIQWREFIGAQALCLAHVSPPFFSWHGRQNNTRLHARLLFSLCDSSGSVDMTS